MEKKISKQELKRLSLIEDSKLVLVNTFEGKKSLYHLMFNVGVKSKVKRFAVVEKLKPKKDRRIGNMFHVVDKVQSLGFVFSDGFEIKNVEKKYFDLIKDVELIKLRVRK